eukprot:TRINITY_DN3436_c0_g1_i1.p2 TRINITY_DN3436_c0_g1~~TRINITY_DN3436_c0_g1_i1.p2  ORF type:complete len:101 (-),score=13.98 TRINITY_DN3436_c0_g1_i1:388-690(-)
MRMVVAAAPTQQAGQRKGLCFFLWILSVKVSVLACLFIVMCAIVEKEYYLLALAPIPLLNILGGIHYWSRYYKAPPSNAVQHGSKAPKGPNCESLGNDTV